MALAKSAVPVFRDVVFEIGYRIKSCNMEEADTIRKYIVQKNFRVL